MPNRGEVSVFRTSGLGASAIWEIGTKMKPMARTLHGRAEIRARAVRQKALDVMSAEPPPRHANIIGWPDDKSKQKDGCA